MFDSQLKSAICCITNSNLSDVHWLRASLPIGDGGLGINRAVEFITALKLTEETPARNRPEKLERAKNIFWEYWLKNFLSYFLGISNCLAHDGDDDDDDNDDKNHGKV